MADKEIAKTWKLYEGMVLQGKDKQRKDDAFKGFIAGWASAYTFMWDIIMHPTPDGHQKIVDLTEEMNEIQDAIEKRVREGK